MGCGEALWTTPVAAQTKLQSIIYMLLWKKGKDFFSSHLGRAPHHKLFWFCFCFWLAEEKCLWSRLVFTKIKVDHLASHTQGLCAPEFSAGLRHSYHPSWRRVSSPWWEESIHLSWPRRSVASLVRPPLLTFLSHSHHFNSTASYERIARRSIVQNLKVQSINCPGSSLTSYPPNNGYHLPLTGSPLISTSTKGKIRSWGNFNQAMMLPCELTGIQWKTRSRLSI